MNERICYIVHYNNTKSPVWGDVFCCYFLFFQSDFFDQLLVSFFVKLLKVVENPSPFGDDLEKAAAGMVVFFVDIKMLGQALDFLGKKGNLHLRGTRVARFLGELRNQLLFVIR